jgi:CRISPR system Cascade subunit CasE
MYLSRLILNPRNRRVQKEIAAPYQMHRSLMRAFPDNLEEGQERVLFRLENAQRQQGLTLLVQSFTFPDWSWLEAPNARGYLLPVSIPNPATKPFELQLSPGQTLAFRLLANPTVKRTIGDKKKRVGLYREEEQRQWLERKAEQGGFHILSARTGRQDIIRGQLKRDDETHKLRFLSVQFDGVLRVSDPERLCESVRSGIGSGKGMGFGLLSLAPPG